MQVVYSVVFVIRTEIRDSRESVLGIDHVVTYSTKENTGCGICLYTLTFLRLYPFIVHVCTPLLYMSVPLYCTCLHPFIVHGCTLLLFMPVPLFPFNVHICTPLLYMSVPPLLYQAVPLYCIRLYPFIVSGCTPFIVSGCTPLTPMNPFLSKS